MILILGGDFAIPMLETAVYHASALAWHYAWHDGTHGS